MEKQPRPNTRARGLRRLPPPTQSVQTLLSRAHKQCSWAQGELVLARAGSDGTVYLDGPRTSMRGRTTTPLIPLLRAHTPAHRHTDTPHNHNHTRTPHTRLLTHMCLSRTHDTVGHKGNSSLRVRGATAQFTYGTCREGEKWWRLT